MKHTVFVALGSNMGDRLEQIHRAADLLQGKPGIFEAVLSPVYETDPVGGPAGQGRYLNAVVRARTTLTPRGLLDRLLEIENALGRKRTVKNAPRTIDLDLLFYSDWILEEPGLKVPHPRLHERGFVLRPLTDLDPEWMHPQLKKNARQLLRQLDENIY